jgi:hypothetical protein
MKTINILGDTQREQWHSVVNMLRQLGGNLTREGRSELCDELDRYIDAMEDANSEPQKLYALTCAEYIDFDLESCTEIFADMETAQKRMREWWQEVIDEWELGGDDSTRMDIFEKSAYIHCDSGVLDWYIREVEVKE